MGTFSFVNVLMYIQICLHLNISKTFHVEKLMRNTNPFEIKYKYELWVETNAVIFVLSLCNVLPDKSLVLCAKFSRASLPAPHPLSLSGMSCPLRTVILKCTFTFTFNVTVFQTRWVWAHNVQTELLPTL
jgi:hypothetical protein